VCLTVSEAVGWVGDPSCWLEVLVGGLRQIVGCAARTVIPCAGVVRKAHPTTLPPINTKVDREDNGKWRIRGWRIVGED